MMDYSKVMLLQHHFMESGRVVKGDYFFNLNYLHQFFRFLTLFCYKVINDVSMKQMMLAFFYVQPTLDRLFNN